MSGVLFLIATYNNAAILQRCLGLMKRLNPQPDKYIFFENNSMDSTMDILEKWRSNYPTEIIRMWFRPDAVQILGNAYGTIGLVRQTLLDRARKLNPDYVIFIDDDIFIADKDFISRIISWRKDIVGAPYLRRYPQGTFLASKWFNFSENQKEYPYQLKRHCSGFQEVFMTSGGAMCIHNKLLMDRRVNFLPIITSSDTSEDYGYCIKAKKLGYKVYLDCSLHLGHYLKATNYKAWSVVKEGYDPKKTKTNYIDFKYGREEELQQKHREILREVN